MFMTPEPFVNFHQSEQMYHIPRSVECVECNPKWKVLCHCAKRFEVEKPFSEQFKALKKFVSFGESLVFQMAPLVHVEITRLRYIYTESSKNWDMLSSEPYGRSNKPLPTEIWQISGLDKRR